MYPPVFALDCLTFSQPYAPLNGSVLTADNSKTKTNVITKPTHALKKPRTLKASKVHGWIKAHPWKPYKQWVSEILFLPFFKNTKPSRSTTRIYKASKHLKPIKFTVGCTPCHAKPRKHWEKHKPSKVHGCIDATPRKATTAKGLRFCFFYLPCFPDLYFFDRTVGTIGTNRCKPWQ